MIGVVAALLTVGTLILSIISVAIPYWESHDDFYGVKVHTGLWQFCAAGKSSGYYLAGCVNIDGFGLWTVPESLKVVRALEILGIILLVFAFGAGVLKLCVKKDVLALFNVAGGLSILAGILIIIGTIIYGVKTTDELDPRDVLHLHAGFGLCVVAGGLSIIGGILFFCDRSRQQPEGQMCRTINQGPVPYMVAYTAGGYPTGTPGAVIMSPPYNPDMPYSGAQYYASPPAYSQFSSEPTDIKSPPT